MMDCAFQNKSDIFSPLIPLPLNSDHSEYGFQLSVHSIVDLR